MDIKDIKIGETYYTPAKVIGIGQNGNPRVKVMDLLDVYCYPDRLHPITPSPKYAPCRLFRKGDKVRVVEWNGRDIARVGQIGYVVSDERNSKVELAIDGWTKDVYYPACHLELVTPAKELEPYYYVAKNDGVHPTFLVRNRNEEHRVAAICECWNEEDAQRICDMYNAEYRKELE